MRAVLAVLLAFVTATLYALSTSLQALEARRAPRTSALRATLIARLARRPVWLAGSAAGVVAWPVQAGALAVGSIALVQPAMGFGLIVLLVLGIVVLHEHVGPREVAGIAAVAVAVAILGWAAPAETGAFTHRGTWAIGVAALVLVPVPHLLRVTGRAGGLATSLAAGVGWGVVALVTALLDASLADHAYLWAAAWGAAVGAVSWGALLAEMTSLQVWPATRAIPIAFGLEMLLPASLAPVLTRHTPPHPAAFAAGLALALAGAILLGGSRVVAHAAVPLTEP